MLGKLRALLKDLVLPLIFFLKAEESEKSNGKNSIESQPLQNIIKNIIQKYNVYYFLENKYGVKVVVNCMNMWNLAETTQKFWRFFPPVLKLSAIIEVEVTKFAKLQSSIYPQDLTCACDFNPGSFRPRVKGSMGLRTASILFSKWEHTCWLFGMLAILKASYIIFSRVI